MNFNINLEISTVYVLGGAGFVLFLILVKFWNLYRSRYKKMKHRRSRIFETSRKTEIKDRLSSF